MMLSKMLGRVQQMYYRYLGVIGKDTRIYGYAYFSNPDGIVIGENCTINHGCVISANKGEIHIGNNVRISPYCRIYTSGLTRKGTELKHIQGKQVIIKDNVWLADGVKVMPGVTIHEGATIYPGVIVTKDVARKQIVKNYGLTNRGK